MTFDRVLGAFNRDEFFRNYYGRHALLLKHEAPWFDSTFSLRDLNNVLNFTPLTYPSVRATDHHNSVHKYNLIEDRDRYANNRNDEIDPEKLVKAIARGATLVVDRVQRMNARLEQFLDALSGDLGIRVSSNAYYSARRTLGVNAHFDRHDVLALQLHGSKRWYYRDAPKQLSKAMRAQVTPSIDKDRTGWSSVTLHKGDVFYCPRGLWHFTETGDESSAHLAIGLYPLTLGEWLVRQQESPRLSELLEEYVTKPNDAPVGASPDSLLERFVDELRQSAADPEFLERAPIRAHLDLD